MLGVLTDPDGFFAEQTDNPSLVRPALVVLAVAIIGTIQGVLVVQRMLSGLSGEGAGIASTIGTVSAVAGGLIVPFVMWLIYAGVFHLLSLAFDPEGDFTTMLSFTGYGYVPSIFSALVSGVITFVLVSQIPVPQNPQDFATFQQQLQSATLYQVSTVVGLVFTLWRAFIWTFAVKHARNLTLKQSGIVVGIPVAVSVIYTIYSGFL